LPVEFIAVLFTITVASSTGVPLSDTSTTTEMGSSDDAATLLTSALTKSVPLLSPLPTHPTTINVTKTKRQTETTLLRKILFNVFILHFLKQLAVNIYQKNRKIFSFFSG
jgi:hypothetical protein